MSKQAVKKVKRSGESFMDARKREIDECWREAHSVGQITEQDMWIIALHRLYGYGPKRFKDLSDMIHTVRVEYAELNREDLGEDKQMAYTKHCMDRELKEALGDDYFIPWDSRYNLGPLTLGIRNIEMSEQNKFGKALTKALEEEIEKS